MGNALPMKFQFETEVLATGIAEVDALARDISTAFNAVIQDDPVIGEAGVRLAANQLIRISFNIVAGSWGEAQAHCEDVIRRTFTDAGVVVEDDDQLVPARAPSSRGQRHLENYGTELALA